MCVYALSKISMATMTARFKANCDAATTGSSPIQTVGSLLSRELDMPQSCDRRSCERSEFPRDPSSTLILEDSAFKRLPPNLHMISDANELTDGSTTCWERLSTARARCEAPRPTPTNLRGVYRRLTCTCTRTRANRANRAPDRAHHWGYGSARFVGRTEHLSLSSVARRSASAR